MSYSNPFNEIFENNHYIHARTLRTAFKRKMWDTFYVFAGSFFGRKRNNHVGLFDYATLMIPHLSAELSLWCFENVSQNPLAVILIIPVTIVALLTNAVRYAAAAVLTAICTPFVGIAHFFSKIKGDRLKTKVRAMKVTVNPNNTRTSKETTIGRYLDERKLTLEDIKVDVVGTHSKLNIEFNRTYTGPSAGFACECCAQGGENHVDASKTLVLTQPQDEDNFKALLELNVGGVTSKLERSHAQFSLFSAEERRAGEEKAASLQSINTKKY